MIEVHFATMAIPDLVMDLVLPNPATADVLKGSRNRPVATAFAGRYALSYAGPGSPY
jgi:hypothetical protein